MDPREQYFPKYEMDLRGKIKNKTLYFSAIDKFNGKTCVLNGQPTFIGKYYINGDTYDGKLSNGRLHGQGEYISHKGWKFVGTFM